MPALIGYISSIVTDVLILNNGFEELVMWLILTLMVLMACYVIAYPKYNSEQMTMLMFGLIYVTVMLSFVFKVRYVSNGILLVWFIYIGSWGQIPVLIVLANLSENIRCRQNSAQIKP